MHFKNHTEVGNKAKHLYLLKEWGMDVPDFCVLNFGELRTLLNTQHLPFTSAGIHALEIPDEWIRRIMQELPGCKRFAVRSSTSLEDGSQQSFAGQFSTLLNVPSEGLKAAIRAVWMSVFNAHVSAYRGSENGEIQVSVIVQDCIESEVSGVVFTADPITGDRSVCVVNAVFGMGEGLVSGMLDADMYHIGSQGVLKCALADKHEKLVYNENGGLLKCSLDAEQRKQACMNDQELIKLRETALELQTRFGTPQDIEFCIRNRRVYILQSRPVTSLKSDSEYLVWDNSNIIESYPGITLPLTFSFISPVYSAVYRQLSSVLGIRSDVIEANAYTYDNMLGLLRGRVYYNLYSWYKLLSLLPGYSLNAGFMEKMMGVSERFELKDYQKPSGFREYLNIARMALSMLNNARVLPAMRQKFRSTFYKVLEAHQAIKIDKADAHTCMHAYLKFEQVLAKEWKAPLVNDFFAMIYYGMFQKFVQKNQKFFKHDHNHYLSCSGKVITVEPARLQQVLCKHIQSDSELCGLFSNREAPEILLWIQGHEAHEFSKLFVRYIQLWGDRCFAELKLETVTYRQDPLSFIRILKQTFSQTHQHFQTHDEAAEAPDLPFFKRMMFRFLRRKAIDTVSERENLRYERTRAFAEVRQVFMRLGELLSASGAIEAARDVFYLSKEEVFAYIKGSSIHVNLKALIALRKTEYDAYKTEPEQSPRIRTTGMVYDNLFTEAKTENTSALSGIPCCKGVVRGRVRILNSPEHISDLQGKIMVTMSTDPGWVSVFPLVAGIIVERGSVLSHAAIVSREMNIPCIVGVKHITSHLKDGDLIEMDGLSGLIRIIESN